MNHLIESYFKDTERDELVIIFKKIGPDGLMTRILTEEQLVEIKKLIDGDE